MLGVKTAAYYGQKITVNNVFSSSEFYDRKEDIYFILIVRRYKKQVSCSCYLYWLQNYMIFIHKVVRKNLRIKSSLSDHKHVFKF